MSNPTMGGESDLEPSESSSDIQRDQGCGAAVGYLLDTVPHGMTVQVPSGEDVTRSKLRTPGLLVRQGLSHEFETTVTRELMQCRGSRGRQWKNASYIQCHEE